MIGQFVPAWFHHITSYRQRKVQFPLFIGAEDMNLDDICVESVNKILFCSFPVVKVHLTAVQKNFCVIGVTFDYP